MNMNFKRKLPIPMEIKEQFPLSFQLEQLKIKRDVEIIEQAAKDTDEVLYKYILRNVTEGIGFEVLNLLHNKIPHRQKVIDQVLKYLNE